MHEGSRESLLLARGSDSGRSSGRLSFDRRSSSGSANLQPGSRKSVVPVNAGADPGASDRPGSRRLTAVGGRSNAADASSLADEGDLDFASASPLLQLMALKQQAAEGGAAAMPTGGSAGGGSSRPAAVAAQLHQRLDQQRQLSPALAALVVSAIASSASHSSSHAAGERRKSAMCRCWPFCDFWQCYCAESARELRPPIIDGERSGRS